MMRNRGSMFILGKEVAQVEVVFVSPLHGQFLHCIEIREQIVSIQG